MGNRPHLSKPADGDIEPVEIIKLIDGRYIWYPEERKVEFYLKGDRTSSRAINLDAHNNTYEGALKVACRNILAHTKDNVLTRADRHG